MRPHRYYMRIGVTSKESGNSTRLSWSELNTLECQAVIRGRAVSLLIPPACKGFILYWVLFQRARGGWLSGWRLDETAKIRNPSDTCIDSSLGGQGGRS